MSVCVEEEEEAGAAGQAGQAGPLALFIYIKGEAQAGSLTVKPLSPVSLTLFRMNYDEGAFINPFYILEWVYYYVKN